MSKSLFAAVGAALVLTAPYVAAQTPAVVSRTGGSQFGSYYGGNPGDVVGFRFTADVDMTVTDLGVWYDLGALDSPHQVGIWRDSDEALLAEATVDATGTLIGEWYYAPLASSIDLVAGERYTAGALYDSADGDTYISSPSALELDGISDTNGVYPEATSLGFVYPALDSTNLARLGPNFLWEPAGGGGLELTVSGNCPGTTTFDVSGATPNGNVALVYGFGDGPTTIPSTFPCAGTVLNVGNPNLDNRVVSADANGNATLSTFVPGAACGAVNVQALDVTTCAVSNVVNP